MRVFPIISVVLVLGGCACSASDPRELVVDPEELADRLRTLPERPRLANGDVSQEVLDATNGAGGTLLDPIGDVVLVSGDRIAVRLSTGSQHVPDDRVRFMAVYSEDGYLGEMLIVETFQGHALGRRFGRWRRQVEVGNRAACMAPHGAAQQAAAADAPQAARR